MQFGSPGKIELLVFIRACSDILRLSFVLCIHFFKGKKHRLVDVDLVW
jgi:hypothetical protein